MQISCGRYSCRGPHKLMLPYRPLGRCRPSGGRGSSARQLHLRVKQHRCRHSKSVADACNKLRTNDLGTHCHLTYFCPLLDNMLLGLVQALLLLQEKPCLPRSSKFHLEYAFGHSGDGVSHFIPPSSFCPLSLTNPSGRP